MALIRYPIAADVQAALAEGAPTAARESEAEALAGVHVVFASEYAGPVYADRDSALSAWVGRLEDDRDGHAFNPPPEERFCKLICRTANLGDKHTGVLTTEPVWQVSVSYWKIMAAPRAAIGKGKGKGQARKMRKSAKAAALDVEEVRQLAIEPLKPYLAQKSLDFGLFDTAPPVNPNPFITDE